MPAIFVPILSLILFTLSCQCTGLAQEEWIGRRVYYKNDAVARIDARIVEKEGLLDFPETVEDEEGDWVSLGQAWVPKKDLMNADEAFEYYSKVLRTNPNAIQGWVGRASSEFDRGNFEQAVKDYSRAIHLTPKRAALYANRGSAKSSASDFEGAIRDYDHALTLEPQYAEAYRARGFAKYSQGKTGDALADYDYAIKLNPQDAKVYADRSSVKYFHRDFVGAMQDASEAIRLDSKCVMALNNLAWIHATAPDSQNRDGILAVRLATSACEVTKFQNPTALGTLAAAYAETGDFVAAVKFLELANELGSEKDNAIRDRMLTNFQARKPFRN